MQELQRFIVAEAVQREKEEALSSRPEAQLKETLEFIETHGHHNQMVQGAKSVDSIDEVVCRIAACATACKDAQRRGPTCHLRQRLDRLGPEPARPTASARDKQRRLQPQPAADEAPMAVDDGVVRRFPAPEHLETMMRDREDESQSHQAPVDQVHRRVAFAAPSPSIHHGQPAATSGPQVHHGVAFAASTPSIHHDQTPAASAPSVRRTHQVVEERMEMDEEAAAVTSSGPRATAPSPGKGNRFALVEEVPNVKSVSDPPSLNVEDAPSEHSGLEGRLAQLEWENKIPLDQAVVTKQTMLKHAEHTRKLERTMRATCELILEARPKEEEAPKPTGPAPQAGLPLPPKVIMRGEPFCIPPPAPQLLVQHSTYAEQWQGQADPPTGLPPAPATLMAGELFPFLLPAPQLLAQLDARHGHSHQRHQHHHQHFHQHHHQHRQHHRHHHQMAPPAR